MTSPQQSVGRSRPAPPRPGATSASPRSSASWGGPIGLFYSAPLLTAGIASAIYVAAVLALLFIPLIGTAALFTSCPSCTSPARRWARPTPGASTA